jgi:hypothetical protein
MGTVLEAKADTPTWPRKLTVLAPRERFLCMPAYPIR